VRAFAPGKLLLTGGYAVLEGAPAIVCAVDRYAVASSPGGASGRSQKAVSPEIAAALGGVAEPPDVDVSSLFSKAQKLGLGSSAAALVAALGHVAAARGENLVEAPVRRAIFDRARAAHGSVQSGGSGVDVAASVYGGVLSYKLNAVRAPSVVAVELPVGLHVDAYWSGYSVRTSDMRARVDRLKQKDVSLFAACMTDLSDAAMAAASGRRRERPRLH
jgi:phosphomevalonate kinase